MPLRLAIPLYVERPEAVLPVHIHALVCEWLERDEPSTRHRGNDKPFATSPLRTHEHGLVAFEVGLLDDELEERLLRAIQRCQSRLRLGRQTAWIVGALQSMGRCSWDELAGGAVPRREFRLEFTTPTVFRSGQTSVPLPLPKLIFGHYRSRWTTFAPFELRPDVAFDDLDLAVSEFDIATSRFPMSRRDQVGFAGKVTLSLRPTHPAVHIALDALASVAHYSGTGAGTPQGMGVTRYLGGPPLRVANRPFAPSGGGLTTQTEFTERPLNRVVVGMPHSAGPAANTARRLQRPDRGGAD